MLVFDSHLDLALNAVDWNRDLRMAVAEIRAQETTLGMTDPGRRTNTVSFPELRKAKVGVGVATVLARQEPPINHPFGYTTAEACYAVAMGHRDLEAMAQGFQEVLEEDYLRYRIRSTEYVGERLLEAGVRIVEPPGGHAIYIDAGAFLPHIPARQFPAQALACAFYEEGGIRGVEIGTLMFGGRDPANGGERTAPLELLRLAIPRRVYTQSHMDYVIEVAEAVAKGRESLRGFRIVEEAPHLRHFTVRLEPVTAGDRAAGRARVRVHPRRKTP